MLTKEQLIQFENEIADVFEKGMILAPVHLSRGNEDQLIDIFKNIRDDDWVFSTHRNHYHALLHGVPLDRIRSQILNRNSITLNSIENKFLTSAIVGGVIPIALGAAFACKLNGSTRRVWVFVGDMAAEMGGFDEAVKYATGHDLPITFIIEDNGKSVNTPTQETWGRENGDNKTIYYSYEAGLPHQGIGKWVTF